MLLRLLRFLALGLAAAPLASRAQEATDFAFVQNPGGRAPTGSGFTESGGRPVRLGELLGKRPLVLALGYFHCPSLCSVVRDDLLEALSHSGMRGGADYDLLVVSIDPAETPAFKDFLAREFPSASRLAAGPDRRQFFRPMAASCAFAGLAACSDEDGRSHEAAYVRSPERGRPGAPLHSHEPAGGHALAGAEAAYGRRLQVL